MRDIVVWGTGEKARSFILNSRDCVLKAVIDNDREKWVGCSFYGFRVQGIEEVELSDTDLIIICSASYSDIIDQINDLGITNQYHVMALDYYATPRDFYESGIASCISDDLREEYSKRLCIRYIGDILNEYLDGMETVKTDHYPISVYLQNHKVVEGSFLQSLWEKIEKKCNLRIIQRNSFGFLNLIDGGFSLDFILKYNFPCDAFPLLACLKKINVSGSVAMDVGANRGIVSCFLADRYSTVHAFEPSDEASKIAYDNFAMNNIHNVIWNQIGVGDIEKEEVYYDYGLAESGHNSFIKQKGTVVNSYAISVTTLDSYCEREGIDRIDLLKLDAEGYEPKIIQGCMRLLQDDRIDIIALEVSPGLRKDKGEDEKMLRILYEQGFHFYNLLFKELELDSILNIEFHQDIICSKKGW